MKRICTLLCVLLFVASNIPAYCQENLDNSTLKTPKAEQKYQNTTVENIETYTKDIRRNTDFDDKAKIAWGAALAAAFIGFFTLVFQLATWKNTKKLSQGAHQKELLIDLARHLYKNLVVTRAMRIKTQQAKYESYPSEVHFQKLKAPMVNFHLDAFYGKKKQFLALHHLYLQFRNYNEEIDVAMNHITDSQIAKESREKDFETLENRISTLTGRIADVMTEIWGKNKGGDSKETTDEKKINIDSKIQKKLQDGIKVSLDKETPPTKKDQVDEISDELLLSEADFNKTQYARIFTSNDEISSFIKGFKNDVQKRVCKIQMIDFK